MKIMWKHIYIIQLCFLALTFSCQDFILGPDPENTPENNFDIIWKEFDRYYPSFISRDINWDSLYLIYRAKINPSTDESFLWENITALLYHLDDIHVALYNDNGTKFFSSSHNLQHDYDFNLGLVKYEYLQGNFFISRDGNFTSGRFAGDSVGYLHIHSFNGKENWGKEIDEIIMNISSINRLIIDVRDNRGGLLENVKNIGGLFTDNPKAFCKEISRNGPGHNDFTSPAIQVIFPRLSGPAFTKQIVVLTNRRTSSASELFVLFLKQLPFSVQIGDSTAGGLGPVRGFNLPNGWLYQMPVATNLTMQDENLEGIGIVPEIFVKNKSEEILSGHDKTLEAALRYPLKIQH